MQTQQIKEDTLNRLQDLITANIDSSEQLESAAEEIENSAISQVFEDLSKQRCANANELKKVITFNSGNSISEDESISGKLRKTWLEVRAKIQDGDSYAVLAEAERCEDVIIHAYEEIIVEVTGTPVNDILHEQYRNVKSGHDKIRDLRDSYKK